MPEIESALGRTLVLHIGLHKTATSYLQHVLAAHRQPLLREGILYPTTGIQVAGRASTREGAESGHALFTRNVDRQLVDDLVAELPDATSTVLLSSEDFTLPRVVPEDVIKALNVFDNVRVVLVVRRQDTWIESFYKQVVDQYGNFETRSFDEFLAQVGPSLLDFHTRFSVWRDLVGPDSFHVLSYDDLSGGDEICRRIVEIAGASADILDQDAMPSMPRYESVRAIDTVGLRILNSYRLDDRETRVQVARSIYDAAPTGDIELMTPQMREAIQSTCASINERIEAEWFKEPVPGFRFGDPTPPGSAEVPDGHDVIDYLDRVVALCDSARHGTGEGEPAA